MKTLLLALLFLFAINVGAQISYEHSYPGGAGARYTEIAHLSAAGYKYYHGNGDSLVLYNMNHSVYMNITVPTIPGGSGFWITWVSDELFNTNPLDIEYVLTFQTSPGGPTCTRIYDQSGNMLFSRDSVYLIDHYSTGPQSIQHTSSGVKMMLTNQYNSNQVVYSLPGVLPCSMCDQGVMSGLQPNPSPGTQSQEIAAPYPNPTQSSITLPYTLPDGTSTGELIVYDMSGREVKRYPITNAFSSVVLETEDFAAGTYSYTIQTREGLFAGNKFTVIE